MWLPVQLGISDGVGFARLIFQQTAIELDDNTDVVTTFTSRVTGNSDVKKRYQDGVAEDAHTS